MALLLETALGDVVIDLDYEGSPVLSRNVLQLASAHAYTRNLIYKVLPQRFCMTGCPVGDGSGGTSIQGLLKGAATALSTSTSRLLSSAELQEKGRVAVQGKSMGSQFLITIDEGKDHALDGIEGEFYSLGVVAEDDNNVLDKINAAYLDPNNRPFADIRILRALVVYDPFEKNHSSELTEFIKRCPSESPERPSQETVEKRISIADIDMDYDDDDANSSVDERKQKELQEEDLQREAQSRAVVLEMLGDLPSADTKAPENALFICKLNPVTTDEDLELIFSRFDQAVKVEIIRDHDTGDSLQYAFAEFTTPKQAQEAYFKMNHALVDDRRILVDFSQSVSKLWDKYHQKMKFSRRADAYLSPGRQPSRVDDRQNHECVEGHRLDRRKNERQGRHDNSNNSRWRHNDQRHSSVHSEALQEKQIRHLRRVNDEGHIHSRSEDDRSHKRDRYNTDEDSYGRNRHRKSDVTHRERHQQKGEMYREDARLRRDQDDEGRIKEKERDYSEDRRGKNNRDEERRRHRRKRGDSEQSGRKRSRDDDERRHRGDSEERRRRRKTRHGEERRHRRKHDDSEERLHIKSRDDDERSRREDERCHHHRRDRDDERSNEREKATSKKRNRFDDSSEQLRQSDRRGRSSHNDERVQSSGKNERQKSK